jgi:hypothetical protein
MKDAAKLKKKVLACNKMGFFPCSAQKPAFYIVDGDYEQWVLLLQMNAHQLNKEASRIARTNGL